METCEPDVLATRLCLSGAPGAGVVIGIDGIPGAGKTTLAQRLERLLSIPVVHLDHFVNKDRGRYVPELRYGELVPRILSSRGSGMSFIVEGICLLKVARVLGLPLDCLIYVKRLGNGGDWIDEDVCEFGGTEYELVRLIRGSRRIGGWTETAAADPAGLDLRLSLMEEVGIYHREFRPTGRADWFYHRQPAA